MKQKHQLLWQKQRSFTLKKETIDGYKIFLMGHAQSLFPDIKN